MFAAGAACAAAPSLDDYARGIAITAAGADRPLIETTVPDVVYQKVTRPDLGDMRVFNAEGTPVPHAFCAAPETTAATVSIHHLPVFDLRDIERLSSGPRIEVQTAGGTQMNVQEGATEGIESGARRSTHIIDARGVGFPLRAIQFDWRSPDGASEARVRIESSEDLDRWTVVVPESALLFARRGAQQIERERIELPQRQHAYLRVARVDGGPSLLINSVTAESVQAGADIEPLWFMAANEQSSDGATLVFDSERLAPVRYARVRLPQENSSARITLESRADEKSQWREQWSGETYLIVTPQQRRESPPARFAPTTDRHWRVRIRDGQQSYQDTMLELGYRPTRMRFLAQGSGPFTLAFGSRRAEPTAASACDALLADVGSAERANLIVEGFHANPRVLGGDTALEPLPQKTPIRLVVLWSVLIGGVALLIAMALSLLKRVRS
jgi:Protein of unknown function (DUF3999)